MTYATGININASVTPEQSAILTPQALDFIAGLARKFEPVRQSLLQRRVQRQIELDAGKLPDFLAETAAVRNSEWTIAPLPAELLDRRVELTGPAERKMLINGLNAGAKVYLADLEDSMTPNDPVKGVICKIKGGMNNLTIYRTGGAYNFIISNLVVPDNTSDPFISTDPNGYVYVKMTIIRPGTVVGKPTTTTTTSTIL